VTTTGVVGCVSIARESSGAPSTRRLAPVRVVAIGGVVTREIDVCGVVIETRQQCPSLWGDHTAVPVTAGERPDGLPRQMSRVSAAILG
jgi:hypothetical protein